MTQEPTAKDEASNTLVLYRLKQVEDAVRDVGSKVDRQDTIKRSDLKDFQETIVTRFLDMKASQDKEIADLKKDKASNSDLQDFKKVVWTVIAFAQALSITLLGYLLQKK